MREPVKDDIWRGWGCESKQQSSCLASFKAWNPVQPGIQPPALSPNQNNTRKAACLPVISQWDTPPMPQSKPLQDTAAAAAAAAATATDATNATKNMPAHTP